jgi:hypothetical protein
MADTGRGLHRTVSGMIFVFQFFKKWVMYSLSLMQDFWPVLHNLVFGLSYFRQFSLFPFWGYGRYKEQKLKPLSWDILYLLGAVRSQCDHMKSTKHIAGVYKCTSHTCPAAWCSGPLIPRKSVCRGTKNLAFGSWGCPINSHVHLHVALDKLSHLWTPFIFICKMRTIVFIPWDHRIIGK